MTTLAFLGDIHGDHSAIYQWHMLNEKSFLVQVGDLGIGFHDWRNKLDKLNNRLVQKDNHVYVIRGNHDDPQYWYSSPLSYSHIHFVRDNTVLELCGKKILCIGGGISIDRCDRLENMVTSGRKTYWIDEVLVYDPSLPTILEKHDVDIVATHISSSTVHGMVKTDLVDFYCGKEPGLRADLFKEQAEFAKVQGGNRSLAQREEGQNMVLWALPSCDSYAAGRLPMGRIIH